MSEIVQPIDPIAVRSALSRMLGSPDFGGSARARAFLNYVVEEKLEGRPDRIKAYSIATSVFGRDVSFDANLDPIVRIEAGRVRRSIERYYLLGGREERLHIGMPKGSYVPTFEVFESTACAAEPGIDPASDLAPSILVEQLAQEGDQPALAEFASGLSRRIVVDLARFDGLRVFQDGPTTNAGVRWDYVLSGTVATDGTRAQVDLVLTDSRCGQTVWADSVVEDVPTRVLLPAQNTIAAAIARAIAEPFGVIHRHRNRLAVLGPAGGSGQAKGKADFYRYWTTLDPVLLESTRQELEQAIRHAPGEAELFACLSLALSGFGGLRERQASANKGLDERALALADRAVMLAPASSWCHYAAGLASWALEDIEGGLDALEVAHNLNPLDRCVAAELGQRYAMLARWDRARFLIGEAFAGNLALPGVLRIGPFLLHFAHGRYDQALAEARRIPRQLGFAFAAVATAEIRLHHHENAAIALQRLLQRVPLRGRQLIDALLPRNIDADLADTIVEGLEAAGLQSEIAPACAEPPTAPDRVPHWPARTEFTPTDLVPDPAIAATPVVAGTGNFGVELR